MNRISILLATLLLGAAIPATAQSNTAKPLTNDDILAMAHQGVPQSTMLAAITAGPVRFDVSAAGILALNAGGVPEAVLNQMIRLSKQPKQPAGFGVATGTFPVKDAAGKTVRYSAWIKTENVKDGYAGIWWRVDGQQQGQTLAFDNSFARMIDGVAAAGQGVMRGATGTTGWTQYAFDLPVAAEARNINFGLIFTGSGTAWFDSLKVELDGVPYAPQNFDADFEAPTAKGFYVGGDGYKVGVDSSTAFTGQQSLKMQSTGDSVKR